jgi:hypothetical protein
MNLSGETPPDAIVRWSPDSTQISYRVYDRDARADVVRLRTIASGEEREVYRGSKPMGCIWAAQHPTLFCIDTITGQLFSLSINSRSLEPLGEVSGFTVGGGNLYRSGGDDRAIYWSDYQYKLFRRDIDTQQSTLVDRIPGAGRPFPDERWLARRDKDKIEIRPMAGGDWKPLVSVGETHMVFTPDGKWVLYHDVDSAGKHGLFRVSTAGGQPERMGDFPSVLKEGGLMVISPDGHKVVAEGGSPTELWILENFEPKQQAAR